MNNVEAFARGEAARAAKARMRVFDWDKAAAMIRDRKPTLAGAGLAADWNWTGGDIFKNGKPVPREDTYTYLASNWATPELELDGEKMDCWRWKDETEWDSHTYWPDSALAILKS